MASIIVRNLPDEIKERLRRRAIRHRRSLEAEVRAILERAAQETLVEAAGRASRRERGEPLPERARVR